MLTKAAVVALGTQWALYVPSALLKTEKFYDLSGGSTFVLLAWLAKKWSRTHPRPHLRQKVITWMVTAWGARLSSYLFLRVLSSGADRRFNGVRDNPRRLFVYWTLQAVWIFVSMLPTLLMHEKSKRVTAFNLLESPSSSSREDSSVSSPSKSTLQDYLGWSIWLLGFFLEALADHQKAKFRATTSNSHGWIDSGLWRVSRHPNYLGEILMWFGIWLSATSAFSRDAPSLLASLSSPLFVTYLLTRVSGVPLLERYADKRWGSDPAYLAFKRRTAVLIPFVW